MSELILYNAEDGLAELGLHAIYAESELNSGATCKENLQVRSEGERQVKRKLLAHQFQVIRGWQKIAEAK